MELTVAIGIVQTTDGESPPSSAFAVLLVLLAGLIGVWACAPSCASGRPTPTAVEIRLPSGALVTVHEAHH